MYSIKTVLVFLLGLLSPFVVLIAQQDYSANIRRYTTEEGLPDNHVYKCFQDRKGILWFLTGSGLVKFDGQQFLLVVEDGFNIDNSRNDFLFEELNGDLWIANYIRSDSSSFIIVNTNTGKVSTLKSKFGAYLSTQIQDIRYAGKGALWASTYQGKIIRIQSGKAPQTLARPFRKGFRFHAVDTLNQTVLIDQPFQNDRDQNIYLINVEGKMLARHQIHYLQRVWATPSGGFQFHNLNDYGWINPAGKRHQAPFQQQLSGFEAPVYMDNVLPLAHDPYNDRYWVFYRNSLRVFNPKSGELQISLKNTQNLWPKNAYTIFVDRQGSIWVCTIEGLYQISLKTQRFQRLLWLLPLGAENPVQMSCRGIFKDEKSGTLYVNTGNCVWELGKTPAREVLCRPTAFYSIQQDQERNIWLGCEDIYRLQPQKGGPSAYRQKIPKEFAIAWSLLPQKDRIWLGLSNGLAYFDPLQSKFFFVNELNTLLENTIIYGIEAANQHQLWLITEKGLILFEPGKGVIAHYWTGADGKKKLPADNLRAIYREKVDCWWLASAEGLIKWNPLSGESRVFTTADGLSNDNIYAVYPDEYGFLWMSSDNGIIQFQKKTFKTRFFLPEDGITHREFNRISHHQDSGGRLYFGSLNGVTSFHPRDFYKDFNQNPNIPLVLSSAQRFSRQKDTLEDVNPEYLQTGKIIFKPTNLYLLLRFALLDYTAKPEATQYEYKMEGLGNQWQPCSGAGLQLAGLPYGSFVLKVRGKTGNGLYSRQELQIRILVQRPFYAQYWFLSLVFVGISASVIAFFRYRNHWLKKRKEELEKEVALQTEKILHDKEIIELQAAQLIKMDEAKTRFFANVTHELRTPLTLIMSPLKTYIEQNQLQPDQAEFLYLAQHHATRLQQMVDDLLDLSKLEAGKLIIQESPIVLQHKIKYLLGSFESLAQRKRIKLVLHYQAQSELILNLDQRLFRMILTNLLSNALKFTAAEGQIELRVFELPEEIQIEVSDTGRGIHPDDLPHVFERYFQTQHPETAYEGGTGIGLALARESSKAMGGSLDVKSIWGEGSTFTWRFPKKGVMLSSIAHSADYPAFKTPPEPDKTNPSEVLSGFVPEGKANLLLVEDNPDLRRYLLLVLSKEYDVIALENGLEARTFLEKNTAPDLIISDIMMPLLDGFQLLEWLKTSDLAQLPVIMLTARGDLGDKLKALQIGVDDYLVKPFVEEELIARINNLLKRQELRRSLAVQTTEETIAEIGEAGSDRNKEQWLNLLEQTVLDQLENPDFSVNDLAKSIFMSRSVLYSEMGRVLGLTPNEYINEIRLLKALEFFQSSPGIYSVKEMASRVGYRDEKYFSRQFKQRFGMLPSQMR